MKFADLHCHMHTRVMYWLYPRKNQKRGREYYNPWTVLVDNPKKRQRARRASAYVQCDMVKSWNSGLRLCFAALYPIEKGFVLLKPFPNHAQNKSLLEQFISLPFNDEFVSRDLLQALYMNLPRRMINFFQSNQYDYFDFLKEEYNFLTDNLWQGQRKKSKLFLKNLPRQLLTRERRLRRRHKEYYEATGIYRIPKNKTELKQIIDGNEDVIIVPLTVEGAHSLGSTDFVMPNGSFDSVEFGKRITALKSWPYPIFFITFAHHFYNGLCGHAQSFPKPADVLLDQDHGKNEGLYPQGEKAIRQLLSITEANEDNLGVDGYRILIDVKHMSAKARNDYYQKIIIPRWEMNQAIPVIASHCGYAGAEDLKDLIQAAEAGKEDNKYRLPVGNPIYNGWNINMSDEDIKWIFRTGGLFGLSFDQRILGVPPKKRDWRGRNDIDAIYDNIIGVLSAIYDLADVQQDQKVKAWDMLAIGTDFEGYINPVDPYPTTLEYKDFKAHLLQKITMEKDHPNAPACLLDFGPNFTPEIAVEKLCYQNALDFLKKWYPEP